MAAADRTMLVRDLYAALGVSRQAGDDELRRTYRRVVAQTHPDVAGPGQEERLRAATSAWAVLSDPRQRALYDALLALPPGVAPDDLVNRCAWTAALRGDREASQATRARCWRVIADTASDRGLAQRARFLARAHGLRAPAASPTGARPHVVAPALPSCAPLVDGLWQERLDLGATAPAMARAARAWAALLACLARVLIRVVVLSGGVGGLFGKPAVMVWFVLAAALFLASQPHLDRADAGLAVVIAVGGYWSTKGVCWLLLQLPPFVVFRRWWGASQFMGVLALVGLIVEAVITRH